MPAEFPRLLEPLEIRGRTVRNRIVLTAHGEHLAEDGLVTETLIRHHERRAEGGTGLIVCGGSASVSPDAANAALISLWDQRNDEPLADLARRVRRHGSVVLCQASHRGVREVLPGLDGHHVAVSPGVSVPPYGAPAVLSTADISALVDRYADAARRLASAGFDGIELIALGTHLIEQFWSPALNRRDDEYGGSFENRLRFGRQVLDAVAAAAPDDFLVAFRMSLDPHSAGVGLDTVALTEIARAMGEHERIDLFDVSSGSGLSARAHAATVPPDDFPEKCNNELAKSVRAFAHKPVLVAGRILTPRAAEETLADGAADLVGMTRALIADPDLPRRVMAREHRRIRPCIAINEGCRRVVAGRTLACTVNPEVGAPPLDLTPARSARNVVVVGGGPAGMEAARVAALRGHRVTLLERQPFLGGAVHLAARLPRRPRLTAHVDWQEGELERAGVDVRRGVEATPRELAGLAPDVVVVATGCRDYVPPELAASLGACVTDVDVLTGSAELPETGRLLVYDAEGHGRGLAFAGDADDAGLTVDYLTPFPTPAHNVEPPNKPAAMRRLRRSSVSVRPDTALVGTPDGARLRDVWTEDESDVGRYELVVVVGHRTSDTRLHDEIAGTVDCEVVRIGDAKAPRLLRNAVSEGARTGASI